MAEAPNGAAAQQPQIAMKVLTQYIRDMSFENILMQKGVSGEVQPDIQVQVNLDAKKRGADNQYEVITKFNVTSKNKDSEDVLFALELEYGGVLPDRRRARAAVASVPDDRMPPDAVSLCPPNRVRRDP